MQNFSELNHIIDINAKIQSSLIFLLIRCMNKFDISINERTFTTGCINMVCSGQHCGWFQGHSFLFTDLQPEGKGQTSLIRRPCDSNTQWNL